jgi:SNF2 family DNA or RNA helicase
VTVRISRTDDGEIAVQAPFAMKDALKATPGARWSPEHRRWMYPATPQGLMNIGDTVKQAGDTLYSNGEDFHDLYEGMMWMPAADIVRSMSDDEIRTQLLADPLPDSPQTAWLHQVRAFYFARGLRAAYLAMRMGTGKSKVVVDLARDRDVQLMLITAPLKAAAIWPKQFRDNAPGHFACKVFAEKNRPKHVNVRAAEAAEWIELNRVKRRPCVVIVNHQAVWRGEFSRLVLETKWDMGVVDEAHRAKDPEGRLGSFLGMARPCFDWRMSLSGTPLPHDVLDAWAQYNWLDPAIYGRSFANFKKRYSGDSMMASQNPIRVWRSTLPDGRPRSKWLDVGIIADGLGVSPKVVHMWEAGKAKMSLGTQESFAEACAYEAAGYGDFSKQYNAWADNVANHAGQFINLDEFNEKFYSIAIYVPKSVLSLPEFVHMDPVPVSISPAARKIYDGIDTDYYARVESGEITVANALVEALRLQQATSGYVMTDDGELVDIGREKIEALAELLDSIDTPVCVFCRFTEDLQRVAALCEETGRVYGEVSGRRDDLTEDSEYPEGVDVLGVQIAAGGVGVDLTRSQDAIYYSVSFSMGDYEQSLDRLHRPGQRNNVSYHYLMVEDSIDEAVIGALRARKSMVDAVLEYRRTEHHGDQ